MSEWVEYFECQGFFKVSTIDNKLICIDIRPSPGEAEEGCEYIPVIKKLRKMGIRDILIGYDTIADRAKDLGNLHWEVYDEAGYLIDSGGLSAMNEPKHITIEEAAKKEIRQFLHENKFTNRFLNQFTISIDKSDKIHLVLKIRSKVVNISTLYAIINHEYAFCYPIFITTDENEHFTIYFDLNDNGGEQ